jgi:type IV secretory pathway TraG/TraD family ATPase VirD4
VHVLDLRDGQLADSLNPLDLAMLTGTDSAAVARSVAAELVARTGNEKDPFWPDQAENLLTAGVAWLLADCEPRERTLGNLYDLLTDDDVPFRIAATLDDKKVRNRHIRIHGIPESPRTRYAAERAGHRADAAVSVRQRPGAPRHRPHQH